MTIAKYIFRRKTELVLELLWHHISARSIDNFSSSSKSLSNLLDQDQICANMRHLIINVFYFSLCPNVERSEER